jgi:hypothetical protein
VARNTRFNPVTITGIISCLIFGSQILMALLMPNENRWTPRRLAPTLPEATDRLVVLADDEPLHDALEEGRLRIESDDGEIRRLDKKDVVVRINNYHKARALKLSLSLIPAFLLGVSIMWLCAGLFFVPRIQDTRDES